MTTPKAHYWISSPRSRDRDRWDVTIEVRRGEEADELDLGRLTILSVTRETAIAELRVWEQLGYQLVSELRTSLELIGA